MQQASTFQIYNASAGSGKTFTLVKEYLKILLKSDDVYSFQKILAITFTNKAAAEMKQRVLSSLKDFSDGKTSPLLENLIQETAIEFTSIQKKSTHILHAILQNYGAFHITTIDSFTYKIIKSFAFDLGLSQNFEVEMNAHELLDQAVEVLLSRIGTDQELTKILIAYSLDKTENDQSWDISRELSDFSKILLNEQDVIHFRKLSKKSLQDFKSLQQKLIIHKKEVISKMKSIGEKALEIIESHHLVFKDFYKSMLPNHFLSLHKNPEKTKFFEQSRLKKRIQDDELYAKSKSEQIKSSTQEILPQLINLYDESERLYQQYTHNKLVLENIIPLAVLNNINLELTSLKEEHNIRLNAEFNQLISDNIQHQPAPYIYERIGHKFSHFFIDEMQDTSVLQWNNLIPLLKNTLAQEKTSLLLVGDSKQAIYRWRGGDPDQFIKLGSNDQQLDPLFLIQKKVNELKINYRSYSEIINFNNSFFKHVSKFLNHPSYSALYQHKSHQEVKHLKGGFVSVSLLEKLDDKEENQLKYAKKVFQIIQELDSKTSLGSVCVLVRKRSEGVTVANYLSENNVEIVSSETLLLSNNSKVNFIVNFLKWILQPTDQESLLEILNFLHDHLQISEDKHSFFSNHLQGELQDVLLSFKKYGCLLDLFVYHQLPFYEKIELIIRAFHLQEKTDAYVQFFLDEVFLQQQKESSVQDFLDFWERKKDSLSVVSSENSNAVKIMTIHKSKGLEFPVVIFPCDLDIYKELKPKAWLENDCDDFPKTMVSFKKELQHATYGRKIFEKRRKELELDNFNLLYVALTRAVEQLYIITEKKLGKDGHENLNYFSGIFISFLKDKQWWDSEKNEYTFGSSKALSSIKKEMSSQIQETFISVPWKDHQIKILANSSKFWGSLRGRAKEYGVFIHQVLSEIIVIEDVKEVLDQYMLLGKINLEEKKQLQTMLQKIISHPTLHPYFSEELIVFNEREIVCNQQVIIPDRLVFHPNNQVTIIDYKTGTPKKEHRLQLENYASVLKSLEYSIEKKLLIYLNETISIDEF